MHIQQLTVIRHVLTKRLHFSEKKMRGFFFKNRVFEPLDLSDHHQNLYTCSEREYCIPTNFHRDRITPDYFSDFGATRVSHNHVTHLCDTCVAPENPLKTTLEWSDYGENLSECSTHVLSKCTNFGNDPISLRVRKRDF